jgi:DNA-directed RNA polymerase subunit RPC12/RpoP
MMDERKTYVSNINCPHCGERIVVRGRLAGRTIHESINRAFDSVSAACDRMDKAIAEAFRKPFRPK